MTPRRWPGRVYDEGEEPDARFSLANERTFLAWVRTSLALLAGAAALDALDLPMTDRLQAGLAVVLALAGLVTAVQAWRGWVRIERALRRDEPLPDNRTGLVVTGAVVVVAVALVAVVVVPGLRR